VLWGRIIFEKLIVVQLAKNLSPCMKPDISFPCSQEIATGSYFYDEDDDDDDDDDDINNNHTNHIRTQDLQQLFSLSFFLEIAFIPFILPS